MGGCEDQKCNKILAIVAFALSLFALVFLIALAFVYWCPVLDLILVIIAFPCGLIAFIMALVKPDLNVAIFTLAIISICTSGIAIIVILLGFLLFNTPNWGYTNYYYG